MIESDKIYLSQNSNLNIDKQLEEKIDRHIKRYGLSGEICAYYSDWEDFCSDWCNPPISYTKTEARELLHNKTGEFMILSNKLGIIRFVL